MGPNGRAKAGPFLRRMDHVVWKEIEQKGILLNLKDGSYFEVNPVGLAIWKKCDGRHSVQAISEGIAKEYGVTSEQAGRDLPGYVAELKRRKLLESAGG